MTTEADVSVSPSFFTKRFKNPADVVRAHSEVINERSKLVREKENFRRHIYMHGPAAGDKFIVMRSNKDKSKSMVIFIHGGYWQEMSPEAYEGLAGTISGRAHLGLFGYELCPKRNFVELMRYTYSGLDRCLELAQQLGYQQVVMVGHSAGGQMLAMYLHHIDQQICPLQNSTSSNATSTPIPKKYHLISSVVFSDGTFDLRPLLPTYVNGPLRLTETIAWNFSPIRHAESIGRALNTLSIHCTVCFGEYNPPLTIDQARAFAGSLNLYVGTSGDYGPSSDRSLSVVELVELVKRDHFDSIEDLLLYPITANYPLNVVVNRRL